MRLYERDYTLAKEHRRGTHRSRTPAETVAAFQPVCRELGITRLANVTGLDYIGIPVYQAIRPNSRTLSVSQGKGLDAAAAKASAMMESIESWHAETMAVPTRYETLQLLRSRETVIDLDRLPRSSRRRFDPNIAVAWVSGYDIVRRSVTWVPYEAVSLNRLYTVKYSHIFQDNSNGLASGNHVLEAILHGLCEVVERDAATIFEYDVSDPLGINTLVDLDTVSDPGCRSVIERFKAAGVGVAVNDMTTDVGVPCYRCLIVDRPESFRPLGTCLGQGCHPAPEIAMLRALTEAAQSRLTLVAGARDDFSYDSYFRAQDLERLEELTALIEETPHPVDFRERPSLCTSTFEGDIEAVLANLRDVSCDSVVVVDLTHERFAIPVVKVLVPGLEGVAGPGYVPGPRAKRAMTRSSNGEVTA